MTGNIVARGTLNRRQYARLCIYVYYRKPAVILYTILGVLVLTFTFFMAAMNTNARGGILIIAFIYAAYLLMRPYLIYLNAYQYFKTSKHLQEEIIYEFNDETLIIQSESSKSEIGWDVFYKIVELKHFFLMYHDARLMNIVPKSFFKNEEEVKALRKLISDKSHLKQKLRSS